MAVETKITPYSLLHPDNNLISHIKELHLIYCEHRFGCLKIYIIRGNECKYQKWDTLYQEYYFVSDF